MQAALSSRITYLRQKLGQKRTRWLIVVVSMLYVTYACFVVMRTCLDVSIPSILEETQTLGSIFDKERMSLILSLGTGCVFMGNVGLGFLVDKLGGGVTTTLCLLLNVVTLIAFVLSSLLGHIFPSLVSYENGLIIYICVTASWCLSRLSFSLGWPGATSLMSNWFSASQGGLAFSILSTSSRFGSIAGSIGLGAILSTGLNWRYVFVISLSVSGLIGLFDVFLLKNSPKHASNGLLPCLPSRNNDSAKNEPTKQEDEKASLKYSVSEIQLAETAVELPDRLKPKRSPSFDEEDEMDIKMEELQQVGHSGSKDGVSINIEHEHEEEEEVHHLDDKTAIQAVKHFFKSPRFYLIIVSQAAFTITMELPSFFPLYLKEVKNVVEPGKAASYASAFNIGCLISIAVAGYLYDALFRWRFARTAVMTFLAFALAACCGILWFFPALDITITIGVMFIMGVACSPGFYLPLGVFCMTLGGKKHSGKVDVLVEGVAYAIAMTFDYSAGVIIERVAGGWNYLFAIVGVACALAIAATLAFQIMDEKIMRREKEQQLLKKQAAVPAPQGQTAEEDAKQHEEGVHSNEVSSGEENEK